MPADLLLKPNGFTQPDFNVWYEGKVVGRILEEPRVPKGHPTWCWSITQGRPYSIENNGWAETKEEAMAAFAERWRG